MPQHITYQQAALAAIISQPKGTIKKQYCVISAYPAAGSLPWPTEAAAELGIKSGRSHDLQAAR